MKLTFKVEDFKPVDGNILVQPGPIKKIKTLQAKTQGNKFDPDGKEGLVELTYEKEPTIMRLGQILGIADNVLDAWKQQGVEDFKIGDWVIYNSRRGYSQKLDLLAKSSDDDKCPVLMQRYEIVAKVNIE